MENDDLHHNYVSYGHRQFVDFSHRKWYIFPYQTVNVYAMVIHIIYVAIPVTLISWSVIRPMASPDSPIEVSPWRIPEMDGLESH